MSMQKEPYGLSLVFGLFLIGTHIAFAASPANQEEPSRKRQRTETVSSASSSPQIYGIATYDALFKYVLSDDKIRPSFLQAFAPDLPIVSSERLDDHMNPVQQLQLLRNFLHAEKTNDTVKKLTSVKNVHVVHSAGKTTPTADDEPTAFLHELLGRFDEIRSSFPEPRYNGTMDFVCQMKDGDYAMIEMQVIPQDYWDRRALAYVGAFYGNQLTRGGQFKHIRRVIGINILGGGKDNLVHWVDTPHQFIRHYKFQEQLNTPSLYIDGIELIQYSIMNAPKTVDNQIQQDWITFFREGHHMTEADVKKRINTPDVLRAFERAKLHKMPAAVKADYMAEDKEYDRYSQYTRTLVLEGEKAKAIDIAKKMLVDKMSIESIAVYTGLTAADIQGLKSCEQTSHESTVESTKKSGRMRKK
jgi:predicted transposase/invertase (TIGR01784 family)